MLAAVLARKVLLAELGGRITWITYYPAVVLAALYGGWLTGLLATGASCLVVVYAWPFFVDRPFIADYGDWLGLSAFVLNCAMIAAVAEAARRGRERALEAGADDFVPKPVHFPSLCDCMARHLGVRFDSAEAFAVTEAAPASAVERQALEALPISLRTGLAEALRSLDGGRIADWIGRVAVLDAKLGNVLQRHASQLHYTVLLHAIEAIDGSSPLSKNPA
jgi:CheY-like chemotaxis protein